MQSMRLPGQLLAKLLARPVLPHPARRAGQGIGKRGERLPFASKKNQLGQQAAINFQ